MIDTSPFVMMSRCCRLFNFCAVILLVSAGCLRAQERRSLLVTLPEDPGAVVLSAPDAEHGDATAALQAAIDHVQATTRRGVVLVPEGTYRISNTIAVWSGIRLVGVGTHRPVLVLAEHASGFSGTQRKFMLQFAAEKPIDAPGGAIPNGTAGTFYSGLINVDLRIGTGNPQAVALRFHVAQHGLVSHVRIEAGEGFAAIEDAGGTLADIELLGGRFGIYTHQTASGWPFLVMDSSIHGQSEAAVRLYEVHAVFVRVRFSDAPIAWLVDAHHMVQLFARDCALQHVADSGLVLSGNGAVLDSVVLEHVGLEDVPLVLRRSTQNSDLNDIHSPAPFAKVDSLRIGIHPGSNDGIEVQAVMKPLRRALRPAPRDVAPIRESTAWVSLRSFGAKGDGISDDTDAVQRAVLSGHPVYAPAGRYLLGRSIRLASGSALVGLNPITTVFALADAASGFDAEPHGMFQSDPLAYVILSGIGLDAGAAHHGAAALVWRANRVSLLDDVRFLGGHGTALPNGEYRRNYNPAHTGDADANRVWDRQPASLLILGGGGTIRNIWSPSPYAAAGLEARDTRTPAHIYLLSSEHHLRHEVRLHNVSQWSFFGLQTEAEKLEGADGTPVTVENSHNIFFAESVFYRVSRSVRAAPVAVDLRGCGSCTFANVDNHSASAFPYQLTVRSGSQSVAAPQFAWWRSDR